jgi:response regulator of citrate/malate metabolism
MAQKPIAMEQLKQILQLQKDGISIREMARRAGISRNSVRKYLSLLATTLGDNNDPPRWCKEVYAG